jgi:hypothetical protein
MLSSLLLLPALLASSLAAPLETRATEEKVQGTLGSDEYWNDFDGGLK